MTERTIVEWAAMAQRVAESRSERITDLVQVAGLDPKCELRFAELSGVSFQNCDLRGFDFTGATLVGCDFRGALIEGALFDQAVIDRVMLAPQRRRHATDLDRVKDWSSYRSSWSPSGLRRVHRRFPSGAVVFDSPFSSPLVIVEKFLDPDPSIQYDDARQIAVALHPINISDISLPILESTKASLRIEVSEHMAKNYLVNLRQKTGLRYWLIGEGEWLSILRPNHLVRAETSIANSAGLFPGTSTYHFRNVLRVAGAGTKRYRRAMSVVLGVQERQLDLWLNGGRLPPPKQRAAIIDRIIRELTYKSEVVRQDEQIYHFALLHNRGMRIARDVEL